MSDHSLTSALSLVSILDDLPDVAFLYRDDGTIVALNTAGERLIGMSRADLIDRFNLFANPHVVSPQLLAAYHAAFRGATQVVPPTEIHLSLEDSPDAPTAWVETTLIPVERRADGTAEYVLGIQRDVSASVRARAEIEAARRTIDAQQGTIDSLEAARREIEIQRATIAALSTPVIEVWDGIVTVPLLGHLDAERAARMTAVLLESVARTRARYAILDLTGVEVIDTATADHVLQVVAALGLLGTTGVLVGIQPEIAQTLVGLGVELDRVRTHQNLRQALKACMREQQRR